MQTKLIFAPSTKQREALEHERLCLMAEQERITKERDEILRNIGAHLDDLDAEISRLGGLPRTLLPPHETTTIIEAGKAIKVGGFPTIRKKRGRPPSTCAKASSDVTTEPTKKKKRGRPRKTNIGPQQTARSPSPRTEVSKTLSDVISSIVDYQEASSTLLQATLSPAPARQNDLLQAIYKEKRTTKRKRGRPRKYPIKKTIPSDILTSIDPNAPPLFDQHTKHSQSTKMLQQPQISDPIPPASGITQTKTPQIFSNSSNPMGFTNTINRTMFVNEKRKRRGRPRKISTKEDHTATANKQVSASASDQPKKCKIKAQHSQNISATSDANVANKLAMSSMINRKMGTSENGSPLRSSLVQGLTKAEPNPSPRAEIALTLSNIISKIAVPSHSNLANETSASQWTKKRGQGRPKKCLVEELSVPQNPEEHALSQTTVTVLQKRGPGRPRKSFVESQLVDHASAALHTSCDVSNVSRNKSLPPTGQKRKRGRPRKNPVVVFGDVPKSTVAAADEASTLVRKRPRGRPRKHTLPVSDCNIAVDSLGYGMSDIGTEKKLISTVSKKKRGRPRKNLSVNKIAVPRTLAGVPEQAVSVKPNNVGGRPRNCTLAATNCDNLVDFDKKNCDPDTSMKEVKTSTGPKKSRGRPRKNPLVERNLVPEIAVSEHEQAILVEAKE